MLEQQPPIEFTRHGLGEPGYALWWYWSRIRGDALVPERRAFHPGGIAQFLPIVTLVEREAPLVWRIRLAGTEIERRSGRKLTGVNYIDLVVPELRQREDRRLAGLIDQTCGALGVRENVRTSGSTYIVCTVSLPLRAHDGQIKQVIATNEELARARLPVQVDSLVALRIGWRQFFDIGRGIPEPIP